MGKPPPQNHGKANGEGDKTERVIVDGLEILWNRERDCKKDEGKGENNVAENINARHASAAHAQAAFRGKLLLGVHANSPKEMRSISQGLQGQTLIRINAR